MVWKLSNSNLPQNPLVADSTVQGLELLELGSSAINSPLFTRSAISSRPSGSGGSTVSPGITPIIDTTTVLTPEVESFLYIIDNFWEFDSITRVNSINLLDVGLYTHYNNKTVLITDDTSLVANTIFYTYVPAPDLTYTYTINLSNQSISNISQVIIGGLTFKSSGNRTFTYDSSSGILLLNASANCLPQPNSLVEIYTSNTFDLSTDPTKRKVYIFDISALNFSSVSYLDYGGSNYSINSSLNPGTLFNNTKGQKVIAIDKII